MTGNPWSKAYHHFHKLNVIISLLTIAMYHYISHTGYTFSITLFISVKHFRLDGRNWSTWTFRHSLALTHSDF